MEQIATEVLTFLTPFILSEVKDTAKGVSKELWEKVKGMFKKGKDKELLNKFETDPKNGIVQNELKKILIEKLESSEEEANNIKNILHKIQHIEGGQYARSIYNQQADKITNINNVNGDVNIN